MLVQGSGWEILINKKEGDGVTLYVSQSAATDTNCTLTFDFDLCFHFNLGHTDHTPFISEKKDKNTHGYYIKLFLICQKFFDINLRTVYSLRLLSNGM